MSNLQIQEFLNSLCMRLNLWMAVASETQNLQPRLYAYITHGNSQVKDKALNLP